NAVERVSIDPVVSYQHGACHSSFKVAAYTDHLSFGELGSCAGAPIQASCSALVHFITSIGCWIPKEQILRSYPSSVVAMMQDLHAERYGAERQRPGYAMCSLIFSRGAKSNDAVSSIIFGSGPKPAIIGLLDLWPKALCQRHSLVSLTETLLRAKDIL